MSFLDALVRSHDRSHDLTANADSVLALGNQRGSLCAHHWDSLLVGATPAAQMMCFLCLLCDRNGGGCANVSIILGTASFAAFLSLFCSSPASSL